MKNRQIAIYLFVFALFLSLTGLSGCSGSSSSGSNDESKSGQVTISGRVTGSGGLPGVDVSAGGQAAETDDNGFYLMENVAVPKDGRLVLSFAGAGKVPATRIIEVVKDQSYAVSVSLVGYNPTVQDNRDPDGAISVQAASGADTLIDLTIPAGSLKGTEGNVDVSMFYGDPTTDAGMDAFPGDFMAAPEADADADILLESVVFTEINITDDEGNEITEFESPAKVRLRLPESLQLVYAVGDTIPWWSFDEEKGIWVREDAFPEDDTRDEAEVVLGEDNVTLFAEAYVSHLSWWNVDVPITRHAVICVEVYDCEGDQPLANVQVEARGVTYNGSSYATTDKDGLACINVKLSEDADNPERVTLWAKKGSLKAQYLVTDPEEGNEENEVFVSTEQGSTVDGSGSRTPLVDPLCLSYDGEITGTVTYAETDTPVSGVKVYSDVGVTVETDEMGEYEMKVPRGDLLLFVSGADSQTVTVGASSVIVDFIIANQRPAVTSVNMDPENGIVASGGQVQFQAQAQDPDGDEITYAWSATAGSPNTGTGAGFTWTAPDDNGSAIITLTVTDDKGASVTWQQTVVYGGTIGGTELKLTIKDDLESNTAVSNVYVVLHGIDNVTVSRSDVTDANGQVDFGDIGQEQATVTIAYEYEKTGYEYTYDVRELFTIVGIPAGDHTFYMDDVEMEEWDYYHATPEATINVTLNWQENKPNEVSWARLNPFYGHSWDAENFVGVPVHSFQKQSDNTISILALAMRTDEWVPVKYGFVTDQVLEDGKTYTVPMGRTPEEITWSTVYQGSDDPALIDSLYLMGERKGVAYSMGNAQIDGTASLGNLSVLSVFSVDSYVAEASVYQDNDSYRTALKRFSNSPGNTLEMEFPNLTIRNFAYAEATFSWQMNGTMARDVINVSGEYYDSDNDIDVCWEAVLPGETTSWSVPDLPPAISDWVDRAKLDEWMEIEAVDFDDITSFEQLLVVYLDAGNPYASSNLIFSVGMESESFDEAQFTTMGLSSAETDSRKRTSGTGSGLSGFLRK